MVLQSLVSPCLFCVNNIKNLPSFPWYQTMVVTVDRGLKATTFLSPEEPRLGWRAEGVPSDDDQELGHLVSFSNYLTNNLFSWRKKK